MNAKCHHKGIIYSKAQWWPRSPSDCVEHTGGARWAPHSSSITEEENWMSNWDLPACKWTPLPCVKCLQAIILVFFLPHFHASLYPWRWLLLGEWFLLILLAMLFDSKEEIGVCAHCSFPVHSSPSHSEFMRVSLEKRLTGKVERLLYHQGLLECLVYVLAQCWRDPIYLPFFFSEKCF